MKAIYLICNLLSYIIVGAIAGALLALAAQSVVIAFAQVEELPIEEVIEKPTAIDVDYNDYIIKKSGGLYVVDSDFASYEVPNYRFITGTSCVQLSPDNEIVCGNFRIIPKINVPEQR